VSFSREACLPGHIRFYWKELTQTRSELNQLKRDLEAAKGREDLLRSEADQGRSLKDQVSVELAGLQKEAQALKDTLAMKNDEDLISEGNDPPAHREDHACPATFSGGYQG